MTRFAWLFMAIAGLCAGCTAKADEKAQAPKKVADQLLAAYSPLRRLSYKDACGSEGPLTICVDRISMTDTATLVEARVRNATGRSYRLANHPRGRVILTNDSGDAMMMKGGEAARHWGPGESRMSVRMPGQLRGEPAVLTVEGIDPPQSSERHQHVEKLFSVTVRLGG